MKTALSVVAGLFLLVAIPFVAIAILIAAIAETLEKRTARVPFVCGMTADDHEGLLRGSFVPKPRREYPRQTVADVQQIAEWRAR